MKKLVIFDLDGTLLNTMDDLFAAISKLRAVNGLGPTTFESVCSHTGNGLKDLVAQEFNAQVAGTSLAAAYEEFLKYYEEANHKFARPYEGIYGLLEALNGLDVTLAVNSNKKHLMVVQLIERFFGQYISFVQGERESEGIPRKPASAGVENILQAAGIAGQDAVYVGDCEVDFTTAHNAGIDFIGVSWGFRSLEELERSGVSPLVEDPRTLLNEIIKL